MVVSAKVEHVTQDAPNYKQILRLLGAYFDRVNARYVTLAETEDGFVWHCFPNGDLTRAASGMFAHSDVPNALEQLKSRRQSHTGIFASRRSASKPDRIEWRKSTVCAGGYEETFRSLGVKLDQMRALSILVVERNDCLSVHYYLPIAGYLRRDFSRMAFTGDAREDMYGREQIIDLINTARGWRNNRFYH